ncbi:MAG: Xaa-Pro peptidase family protein [Candidatus Omnitrophica bacterium]|nr:Xaa-Pro peptidase family protein [Candidatus Omnitrophota bacterium]
MNLRIKKFLASLKKHHLDAYLVTNDTNIRYLTGFPASESWLLVTPRGSYYITDARYTLEAKKGLKGVKVQQYTQSIAKTIFELAESSKVKTLGFDARHLSLWQFQQLKKTCPRAIKLVIQNGLIEELREIKEPSEVQQIRECLKIHFKAYSYLKGIVRPGISEKAILTKLEGHVKSQNVGFSFPSIIASGPHSCFPHAKVTSRKLQKNEPVLIDMGIDIHGYKSDLTRMFFLGRIPPRIREVEQFVKDAQEEAIKKIKPGVIAADVDRAARQYLEKHGVAQYFSHSLGHGVGLDIHEAPRLSQYNTSPLKEGMVITVEPAVYIPNQFGIRIEDMVLVTAKGCEVLSR